jgi:hypothetical protein
VCTSPGVALAARTFRAGERLSDCFGVSWRRRSTTTASSWSIRVTAGCASSDASIGRRAGIPGTERHGSPNVHRVAPGARLSTTGGAPRRPARTVPRPDRPVPPARLGTGLPDGVRDRASRVERGTGDLRCRAAGVQPERVAARSIGTRSSRPLHTSAGRARSPTSRSSRRSTRASDCQCR